MRSYLKFLSRNKLYTTIEAVGLAVAAITLAVVTLQSWRAASANPVESLKNE